MSLSPWIPASVVSLSKDKGELYCWACPGTSMLGLITTSAPLEFASLGKTHYAGASAVSQTVPSGCHLCTVQGAVLPQFPLSGKHKPRLTEAAFLQAVQPLTDASRCDLSVLADTAQILACTAIIRISHLLLIGSGCSLKHNAVSSVPGRMSVIGKTTSGVPVLVPSSPPLSAGECPPESGLYLRAPR